MDTNYPRFWDDHPRLDEKFIHPESVFELPTPARNYGTDNCKVNQATVLVPPLGGQEWVLIKQATKNEVV